MQGILVVMRGASIGSYASSRNYYLSPEDYEFLVAVLAYYFDLEDVTLSGGDPFVRKDFREIGDKIAAFGLRTTALTKGLPLFSKDGEKYIKEKAGNLSRIIFSIDFMDARRHAAVNLPLVSEKIAAKALAKTLTALEKSRKAGYRIDINCVVPPVDFGNKKEVRAAFHNTKRIIEFALESGVSKIKFIELDLKSTLGKPYIEEYFRNMKKAGYFGDMKT